jgi:hypothetical protein
MQQKDMIIENTAISFQERKQACMQSLRFC